MVFRTDRIGGVGFAEDADDRAAQVLAHVLVGAVELAEQGVEGRLAIASVEESLDRNGIKNRRDETLTLLSPTPLRQLNANLQLRHGDRRYSNIITVVERLGQRTTPRSASTNTVVLRISRARDPSQAPCPREAPAVFAEAGSREITWNPCSMLPIYLRLAVSPSENIEGCGGGLRRAMQRRRVALASRKIKTCEDPQV